MMHTTVSDFLTAAKIDAEYEKKALEWEAVRRVDERVAKKAGEESRVDEGTQAVLTAMLAAGITPSKQRLLEQRFEVHQQALVEALQENREKLDASREHLDDLLSQAHTHEDGRRVFKSEDGTWVVDETGEVLSEEEIDPDIIADAKPSAETWLSAMEADRVLLEQQEALIAHQSKLDDAQELMAKGDLSQDEYDDLNGLLADAPTVMRSHLPADDPDREVALDGPNNHSSGFSNTPDAAPAGPSEFDPSKLFQ